MSETNTPGTLVVRGTYAGAEILIEELDTDDDAAGRLAYWAENESHEFSDLHLAVRTVSFARLTAEGTGPAPEVSGVEVWTAERVETFGDHVTREQIGVFSTDEKAKDACERYAGEPLGEWGIGTGWQVVQWDNPRDKSSDFRFEVHQSVIDQFPGD